MIDLIALKAGRTAARQAGTEPGISPDTADLLIDVSEAALNLRAACGAPSMESKALQILFRALSKIEPWDDERARHRLATLRDGDSA